MISDNSFDQAAQTMQELDALFSHVWMVRTFLKHSEESAEDEELAQVHRELYDAMHALGAAYASGDSAGYIRQAKKKRTKLKSATDLLVEIQPEISTHMNFQMAVRSLKHAMDKIEAVLDGQQ